VWTGYCNNFAAAGTDIYDLMLGTGWGTPFGNTNCNEALTSRDYSLTCKIGSTEVNDCNSTQVTNNNFDTLEIKREDFTIHPDVRILDDSGNFDTVGFMSSLEGNFLIFEMAAGVSSGNYNDGPPAMHQVSTYMEIPKGALVDPTKQLTGTSAFVIYDAGFKYQKSARQQGVGSTTDYSAVTFTPLTGATVESMGIKGTQLKGNITAKMCTAATNPKVCMSGIVSASGVNYEGLVIDKNAMKADIFVDNIAYSGSDDSYGLRVMTVSTSFSGSVAVEDTGSGQSEDSETFGAAYLITEKTVKSSNSPITFANMGSATSADVTKNTQTPGASGSECGYSSGDWWATAQGNYANALEFFQDNGFPTMKCSLFSFAAGDATKSNFMWDPILGIDGDAAKAIALGSSSSSSDSDNTGMIVGVVIGVLAFVGIVGAIYYFKSKKTAGDATNAAL